ncbi:stage II sporulation protein R [Aneurinibacillus soli]|uniref:Stage II sporulation protein R n=1 Tax=Aneurinibacillus soli TaxID=1500254 RepID=A0A0U5ARL6_9BACL|nr:stage II sporulation protein R [Aneurinibacillus soli]PYE61597.1 stage II sporulation protein R [Aneurinibacillus soli]BAU26449.1 Stage II sporulation protein R [Aneurinibacillus soli]
MKRVITKKFLYIAFVLIVIMMNWEGQRDAFALVAKQTVPEESIRLRILANSDAPEDQQLKRHVRDRVIESVKQWSSEAENADNARVIISNHLPELQGVVKRTIQEEGYSYPASVELRATDFPTKMYGTQVFPAGQYEAVRIAIGNAEGQNWWCVLFPPLCFTDISNGDTTSSKTASADKADAKDKQRVEVRFFLLDWLTQLFA